NYYIDALHALIEGRDDDALTLLTKAVRMGESSTDAYLQLGNLLRERGHHDRALQLHKGLMIRRDLGDEEEKAVTVALADDFAALGRIDRAIQTLEQLSRRRKDPEVMFSLHRLHHRNGDYDRALSSLRDVGKIDKSYGGEKRAGYLASVADALIRDGREEEAGNYLDRARKEHGESIPALYISGMQAVKRGDLDASVRNLERLLEVDIGYFAEVLPCIEKALFEAGRFQDLERFLRDLLKRNPGEARILTELASFYEKKGEIDEAVRLLEEERELVSGDPAASARLASLYLQRGETQAARRMLETVDTASENTDIYFCRVCGNVSSAPLSYCSNCSSFDTFTRDYEKIDR
ncbi:MAG TPA: tetratricopeptide repeat protein, partial [Candidatus Eisenbacteria bacterium]|nr:tetratricopeptide repeat protein [Candidatus Eisenbacteria bacterium]